MIKTAINIMNNDYHLMILEYEIENRDELESKKIILKKVST